MMTTVETRPRISNPTVSFPITRRPRGASRRGWPGLPARDSSYAKHTTPEGIATLLRETGMDYFVLDLASALPGTSSRASLELTTAYAHSRYRVFKLKGT
jgi:hypothetical protein